MLNLLKLIYKFIDEQNKQKPETQKKKALEVTKKPSELLKSHIKKPQQKKRDFCDDEIEQMFIYEEPEGMRMYIQQVCVNWRCLPLCSLYTRKRSLGWYIGITLSVCLSRVILILVITSQPKEITLKAIILQIYTKL